MKLALTRMDVVIIHAGITSNPVNFTVTVAAKVFKKIVCKWVL